MSLISAPKTTFAMSWLLFMEAMLETEGVDGVDGVDDGGSAKGELIPLKREVVVVGDIGCQLPRWEVHGCRNGSFLFILMWKELVKEPSDALSQFWLGLNGTTSSSRGITKKQFF